VAVALSLTARATSDSDRGRDWVKGCGATTLPVATRPMVNCSGRNGGCSGGGCGGRGGSTQSPAATVSSSKFPFLNNIIHSSSYTIIQYIPIIIAHFLWSLLFLFHFDNVTADTTYVSSLEMAVVSLAISPAVTSSPQQQLLVIVIVIKVMT